MGLTSQALSGQKTLPEQPPVTQSTLQPQDLLQSMFPLHDPLPHATVHAPEPQVMLPAHEDVVQVTSQGPWAGQMMSLWHDPPLQSTSQEDALLQSMAPVQEAPVQRVLQGSPAGQVQPFVQSISHTPPVQPLQGGVVQVGLVSGDGVTSGHGVMSGQGDRSFAGCTSALTSSPSTSGRASRSRGAPSLSLREASTERASVIRESVGVSPARSNVHPAASNTTR